jgi:hypothetical protein
LIEYGMVTKLLKSNEPLWSIWRNSDVYNPLNVSDLAEFYRIFFIPVSAYFKVIMKSFVLWNSVEWTFNDKQNFSSCSAQL